MHKPVSIILKQGILALLAGILFSSCKETSDPHQSVNFDRKAMLINWADNLIMPAYLDFEAKIDSFHKSVDALSIEESQASLQLSRALFEDLQLSFQAAKIFEVGPAAQIGFRSAVNIFPADTSKILANISQGDLDFETATNIDAKGLPAIDYLLYARADELLVNDDMQAYLQKCADHIHHQIRQILTAWNGGYREDFIAATGTDIGSSLGQMVNAMNKDFELIKNAKIGFPAGKRTMGTPYPYTAEAPYSDHSLAMAIANVEAIHRLYLGTSFDQSEINLSLRDYLAEMQVVQGEDALDEDIHQTLLATLAALGNIPAPFSDAVVNHPQEVDAAYQKMIDAVILLKSEMPSVLGVLITYQDNDGD